MKRSDRTILIGVGAAMVALVFLLAVLMPKRSESGKLEKKVETARAEVEQTESAAAAAAQARHDFPRDYRRLIVLGKAVPSDSDSSSLLVQLDRIATNSGVQFRGIELSQDSAGSQPAAAPTTATGATGATGTTGATGATGASGTEGDQAKESSQPDSQPVAATPTEAEAAALPIGATVGSAGLPVMPYKLTFRGGFFQMGDFIAGVQNLVDPKAGRVSVTGRLLTIDGFSLSRDEQQGFPKLKVSFAVTSYLTPPDERITVGATPAGPAPAQTPPATAVASRSLP